MSKTVDETLKELEERFELRGPRNASQAIEWHGVFIDVKCLIAALRQAIEQRDEWHGLECRDLEICVDRQKNNAELVAILQGKGE